jgi:tetratricopeptide (TPR) repeat protein
MRTAAGIAAAIVTLIVSGCGEQPCGCEAEPVLASPLPPVAPAESADMNIRVLDKLLESGESAEWRDDWQAAEENYRQAITLFPRHGRAWAHYGEFQRFYRHNDDEAARAFERALKSTIPDIFSEAFSLRGLGELAEKKDDTKRALELMQQSLKVKPLSDTHRSLAHLYGRIGQPEEAAKHAKLAAELDPDDPIALLLYAAQLERAGKHEIGAQAFKKAINIGGCDAEGKHSGPVHCCVFYNSAGYYAVKGEHAGALKMLEAFFKTPNHRHLSREHVLSDPDFTELKRDPAFMKIIDAYLPAAAATTH